MVAIDLLDMAPIAGVDFVQLDFLDPRGAGRAQGACSAAPADVVLSDMAANATGHRKTDHLKIMALAEAAAEFAREVLAPGGAFLCKVLQGGTEATLLAALKRDFASVKHVKPAASRADSAELYLLATGFRGRACGSVVGSIPATQRSPLPTPGRASARLTYELLIRRFGRAGARCRRAPRQLGAGVRRHPREHEDRAAPRSPRWR